MTDIGIEGSGADTELKIMKETDKAFKLLTDEDMEIWMPKSAFDDEGILKDYFLEMFLQKTTGEEKYS